MRALAGKERMGNFHAGPISLAVFVLAVAAAPIVRAAPPRVQMSGQAEQHAAAVQTSGVLGSEFQISSMTLPGDAERAAVVYNRVHGEYLVVWRGTGNALYGQRIARTGGLEGSAFLIGTGSQPAAAYNATDDEYLVVWSQDGISGRVDVYGRRITWQGLPQGGSFPIWSWANRRLTHPRAAWNSHLDEYFVVWGAADASNYQPTDVAGVIVSAGGVPGTAANIISATDSPHSPDITFNPGTDPYSFWSNVYYAVWRAADPWNGLNSHAIVGAVGRSAGTQWSSYNYLSDRRESVDNVEPAVAANQFYFFAAWRNIDYLSWNAQIDAIAVGLYGTPSTSVKKISPPTDILYSGPPSVAAPSGTDREFLVVWVMPTIVGRSIMGSRCTEGVVVAVTCDLFLVRTETVGGASFMAMPTVASGGRGYLMTYGAYPLAPATGGQNIYGRLFLSPAMFLPLLAR